MRLHIISLFVASSLFSSGSSLPFFARKISLNPRATYSVVPVDGGPTASTNSAGQGEVTVVQTIIQTPSPTTQTVVETDTLPPTTEVIMSTQTVEGPRTTQTVDITLTPSATPVTITATEYSVIDISAPTTIVFPPTTTPNQPSTKSAETSASSTKTPTSNPNSTTESASTPTTKTSATSSTSSTSSTLSTPVSSSTISTFETSYISSVTQVTTSASMSTASYDNGQWHTTYPTWSNGTATLRTAATPIQTMLPHDTGTISSESRRSEAVNAISQFFRRFCAGFR